MLRNDMANQHIELLGLKSRCLEVAHYNRMVMAVDNKAKVLFTAVAELMQSAIDAFPNEDIDIAVDRQGGRSHYQPRVATDVRRIANCGLSTKTRKKQL